MEWFHPHLFSKIVQSTFTAFQGDDHVEVTVVKLLKEIANNRNSRLRFEMHNVYGLVVFKETASYITRMLEHWTYL